VDSGKYKISQSCLFLPKVLFTANDSVADMRACLWKLPFDPDDEPLADDGHPHSLVKLSDIGGKDEGDMKW